MTPKEIIKFMLEDGGWAGVVAIVGMAAAYTWFIWICSLFS